MNRFSAGIAGVSLALASAALFTIAPSAQGPRKATTVSAASSRDLREWDAEASAMLRSGDLRVRQIRADTLLAGRMTRRADQYYKGVRVFGADVALQQQRGVTLEIFGQLYGDIDLSTTPGLSEEQARGRVAALAGTEPAADARPELMVLPVDADAAAVSR